MDTIREVMKTLAADAAATALAGAPAAGTTAGAAPSPFPMKIDDFLEGRYLRRADVVLTRKHRDFRSWLIRWATHGHFSHAALLFLVPYQEQGFNNAFVIEAASGGVDLTNFRDYLNDRRSVVGIKRLQAPWFDGRLDALVRGRMLNSIKSRYSYRTALNIGLEFLNELAFGVKSRVFGSQRAIADRRKLALKPPNQFICSGLVQLGFVHALVELVAQAEMPPHHLSSVVFRPDLHQFLPQDWEQFTDAEQLEIMWDFAGGFRNELEAATPEDLARSDRLEWVYIIRDGLVYMVQDQRDAAELLNWRPAD